MTGHYISLIPDIASEHGDLVALPVKGKVDMFLAAGASPVEYPTSIHEWVPNLVVVVDNGYFEVAAYCDTPEEMARFARLDGRPKTWLIVPNAKELAR